MADKLTGFFMMKTLPLLRQFAALSKLQLILMCGINLTVALQSRKVYVKKTN